MKRIPIVLWNTIAINLDDVSHVWYYLDKDTSKWKVQVHFRSSTSTTLHWTYATKEEAQDKIEAFTRLADAYVLEEGVL